MIESFKKGSQEKQFVRDQEKAYAMAEVEDHYRDFAMALREYMEDPVAFRTAEAEKVARVKQAGDLTTDDSNDYMELYRAGVRPRDLEKLGEKMAEHFADEYDFEKDLVGTPSLMLRAQVSWFKILEHFLEKSYAKAISNIDFSSAEGKSYVVTHLLNQLGAGDEHASSAERLRQLLTQNQEMQRLAQEELIKRGGGSEPAVA
jgi:hypothetical protein